MTAALLATPLALAGALAAGLQVWRLRDEREADRVWRELAHREPDAARFDPCSVNDLPGAARRFFLFTIRPDAPLRTVVRIRMRGELGFRKGEEVDYRPMRATQILAPPHGFVWKVAAGRGAMQVSGSEGFAGARSWSRLWLARSVPIARAGGGLDHARAAFGRLIAEAVFWVPAALLPREGVVWEAVDANTARVTVRHLGLRQTVDVTVGEDGRPTRIVMPRWTDANPDRIYRLQRFGGEVSDFDTFEGYRLPRRVEGGNFFGTEDYFPFFKAKVDELTLTTRTPLPPRASACRSRRPRPDSPRT